MPTIALHQVDAFTDRPFGGNPAAVCPLAQWLPDAVMQAIAAENNLSETAFFVAREPRGEFDLRWFTPRLEVDLCGHATLASGLVALGDVVPDLPAVVFHTRSGPLTVRRAGDALALDLPALPVKPIEVPPEVAAALGVEVEAAWRGAHRVFARLRDAETVRAAQPDLSRLEATGLSACITAPGTGPDADVDFVSRYFAPAAGIPEDPVTGSAHCALAPLWAERLGRTTLRARQVSARGGELGCVVAGDRVTLTGRAIRVLTGRLWF